MKWLIIAGFLVYLVRSGDGGVLKCPPGAQEALCSSEINDAQLEVVQREKGSFEVECLAGSEWDSNCHHCKCSSTGVAECSKQSTCDTVVSEPVWCKANTTFSRECNTCVCLDNGMGLCSIDHCTARYALMKTDLVKGKDCAPNTTWDNQCNSCACSHDGYALCTEKACVGYNNDNKMRCAPESVWRNDCNTCWCTATGQAICTRMGCSADEIDSPILRNDAPDTNLAQSDINEMFVSNATNKSHDIIKRAVCKPNLVFLSECNICKCSKDGNGFTCTNNECIDDDDAEVEVFMENDGEGHIERHTVCKPRATFYVSCNTCRCNLDGSNYSCTNKPCPLPKDVEIFHELMVRKSNVTQNIVCTANRMFIKDCNICWCNEAGTSYFCTRKICVDDTPDEFTGLKAKNATLLRKTRSAQNQEAVKACQPGAEFRVDCNKCLCDNEGSDFSCTRIDCRALNNNNNGGTDRAKRDTIQNVNMECSPGTVFEQGCSVCRCTQDGHHAVCSLRQCVQNQNSTNEAKTITPDSDSNFRCNPGEQIRQGCNDCTCAADGKGIFCSLLLCDSENIPN